MSGGVTRPDRSALIAAAIAVAGAVALIWGVSTMAAIDGETPQTAVAVSFGLLGVVLGTALTFNFLWGARVVARMRRGEGVIARWTVTPDTFERFREDERRREAEDGPNDWRLPRRTPEAGVEVIFTEDGVLVGETFFGLASAGLAHVWSFQTVADNPLALRFDTAMTTSQWSSSGSRLVTQTGVLRIPVATGSNEALARVVEHFRLVLAGERLVRPGFWNGRVKFGLWTAGVFATIAASGFALNALGVKLGVVPLLMAVVGVIVAIGGLVLALIASRFAARQRRGWSRD